MVQFQYVAAIPVYQELPVTFWEDVVTIWSEPIFHFPIVTELDY